MSTVSFKSTFYSGESHKRPCGRGFSKDRDLHYDEFGAVYSHFGSFANREAYKGHS
jgi:hypothetical protein